MKRKYYLRGIGVGILFTAIVLMVAYVANGRGQMSDEEIMEQAAKLGMVPAESVLDSLDRPSEKSSSQENTSEASESESTQSETTDSEASSDATTEAASTTAASTSEASTAASSEENSDVRIVTFTVVSGMNSWNVATILQDQGVIESASDFDAYLEEYGYSARIVTGEYSVAVGTDYEAIAKLITGQN
jgi:hypothetical protein